MQCITQLPDRPSCTLYLTNLSPPLKLFSPLQLGEYTDAVHCYSAAIAVDPKSSYAYYNRGITRDKLSNFKGAIQVCVGGWVGGCARACM